MAYLKVGDPELSNLDVDGGVWLQHSDPLPYSQATHW